MNASGTSKVESGIVRTPVASNHVDHGLYLWVIIGCTIGGAVILTAIIAAIIYLKRRTSKIRKAQDLERPRYISGAEFCYQNNNRSSFSSTGSDDDDTLSESAGKGNRGLGQCASFNNPGIPSVVSECVQPKQSLPRWQAASHCQSTTIVPGSLDTNPEAEKLSDDECSNNDTCANGRLWFSIHFRPNDEELKVTLIKAKYLPGRGLTNSPRDPYVKIFLLPDEESYQQSKIRKRTLAPKFNETFTYKVNSEDLTRRSVRFSMYDVDKRKVRHNLGHVVFSLNRQELLNGEVLWKDMETTTQQSSNLGEIRLSLGYNPYTNRIKVTVGGVKNIQGIGTDDISIYVKVQLYHGHKLMKSKRTVPQPLTDNSGAHQKELLFDEAFSFGVSGRFFDSCSFTFTAMLAGITGLQKDKPHGRIVIGPFMYARGDQLQHWQDMLTNARNVVTRWHNLESMLLN